MKGEFYSAEYLPNQPAECLSKMSDSLLTILRLCSSLASKVRRHAEELFQKYSKGELLSEKANFTKAMQDLTNE
jgi:hypothetical protein